MLHKIAQFSLAIQSIFVYNFIVMYIPVYVCLLNLFNLHMKKLRFINFKVSGLLKKALLTVNFELITYISFVDIFHYRLTHSLVSYS